MFKLALLISWCATAALALDLRLKQAEYLYEIAGDKAQAVSLLHQVAQNGGAEGQKALAHLGRIYDLQGQTDSARWYYQRFLEQPTKDWGEHQWISTRWQQLDSLPPQFIGESLKFNHNLAGIFAGGPHLLFLLENGSLYTHRGANLTRIPLMLRPSQQIIATTAQLFWVNHPENENQVLQYDYAGNLRENLLELDGKLLYSFPLSNQRLLLATARSLYFFKNHRPIWQKLNNYSDCHPSSEAFSQKQIYFNCWDNAVRVVSLDDGQELETINFLEPVDTVISTATGMFVSNKQGLLTKISPHTAHNVLWQKNFVNISSIAATPQVMAVLEADGSLNLLNPETGQSRARNMLEPGVLFHSYSGLGLISWSGNLFLFDHNGKVYLSYQTGFKPQNLPWSDQHQLLVQTAPRKITALSTNYYGTPAHALEHKVDSMVAWQQMGDFQRAQNLATEVLQYEPGNKNAWVVRATVQGQMGAGDSATWSWSQAARYANHNIAGYAKSLILREFAQSANALWIQSLPATHNFYPKIISNEQHIFSIDVEASNLVAIDPATGQYNWRTSLQKLDNDFAMGYDHKFLALSSHYRVAIYDLQNKGQLLGNLDLPGKAAQIMMLGNAIYISTWNGFVVRFNQSNLQAQWSRKLFPGESLLAVFKNQLVAMATKGDLVRLDRTTGAIVQENSTGMQGVTHLSANDSLLFALNLDGQLQVFNSALQREWSHAFGQQVFSLQPAPDNHSLLLGLANQQIQLFDLPKKSARWVYQGSNSIFVKPLLRGQQIFIDQGPKVVQLDLQTGSETQAWSLPGGSGNIWLHGNYLIAPSPWGFLYQFALDLH